MAAGFQVDLGSYRCREEHLAGSLHRDAATTLGHLSETRRSLTAGQRAGGLMKHWQRGGLKQRSLGGRKIWSAEGWFKKFWDDYLIG